MDIVMKDARMHFKVLFMRSKDWHHLTSVFQIVLRTAG